jgi:ElaB/YqjD/DUF883 family membrane-anchored ribosome-binding protein
MNTAKRNHKSHLRDTASDLLDEGKKWAHEMGEEVNKAEEHLIEYSNQALKKVQEHPLATVLITGGIGFLLCGIGFLVSRALKK